MLVNHREWIATHNGGFTLFTGDVEAVRQEAFSVIGQRQVSRFYPVNVPQAIIDQHREQTGFDLQIGEDIIAKYSLPELEVR